MKYEVKFTNQFKKDLKLAKKQNKNLDKLFEIMNILADGGILDAKYHAHNLSCKQENVISNQISFWYMKSWMMCLFSCYIALVFALGIV